MPRRPPRHPPAQPPSDPPGPAGRRARPAAARTPGRPEGGGPDLRDRLLDAAVLEFAARGFAAARLREIATAADATPALLHYYFGGKEALLEAVIDTRLMPVMAALRDAVAAAGDDPGALIRGFVRTTLRIAFAHPWLPQLWVREVLHEGGALRGFLHERVGPMLPLAMVRRFAAAQAAGRLNPRIDVRLLVPSLLGQTMFMAASAPIWREVLAVGEIDDAAVAAHVLALLEQGLELKDA